MRTGKTAMTSSVAVVLPWNKAGGGFGGVRPRAGPPATTNTWYTVCTTLGGLVTGSGSGRGEPGWT